MRHANNEHGVESDDADYFDRRPDDDLVTVMPARPAPRGEQIPPLFDAEEECRRCGEALAPDGACDHCSDGAS